MALFGPAGSIWPGARAGLSLTALLCVVAGGCSGTVGRQGRSGVEAVYSVTRLSAELPPEVPVPTVAAAASAELRARGYVVTREEVGRDRAVVAGKLSGDGWLERITVRSSMSAGGTRVSVTREPLGDEAASRDVLENILRRMGL